MAAVSFIAVLVFDTVVSIIEIPKMLSCKLYKELAVFSVLLVLATAATIMKILSLNVPNPTSLIIWFFSPVSGIMKWLSESV
jgi:hypothetical protein